jgi:hypothetical protein
MSALAPSFAVSLLDVRSINALYWTAIINGLLAPFLLLGIFDDRMRRSLMQTQPSPLISRIVVGFTIALMFGAAVGMFVF